MQPVSKMKALSVLSMAVVATMGAKTAHAAALSLYYNNIVDFDPSTNTVVQAFGYGAGNTNGASYTGPTSINIAVGDILEFGVDAVVTNNVNPDGGKLTGTITVSAGKTTKVQAIQPSYLGLSSLGMVVASTDATASILTPMTSGSPTGTFSGAPDYNSTAAINGANGYQIPSNADTPGPSWTQNTLGDVSPAGPNGGDVGDHFAIFGSSPPPQLVRSQEANYTAQLAQFGAATATYFNATDFFDSLNYTASSAGTVLLSPSVQSAGTSYWLNTKQGSPSVASGYIAQQFNQPGDVVGTLPSLLIHVGPNFFEPKHSIISLTPASEGVPFGYGLSQGVLSVNGHDGNYNLAQLTCLPTSAGYVEANGFNPGTDEEIYAIDVLDDGTQATPAEIAVLVNAINRGDGIVPASVGVTAAAAYADLPVVDSSPFGSQYNLFLDFASGLSADNFLAFDVSLDNDPNLNGLYAVSAIAVIPEPMSLGLLALGGVGLLTQRPRRRFF